MLKGKYFQQTQIGILKKIEIFSSLPEENLKILMKFVRFHTIDDGKTLFEQGDHGQELYVILSGEIGISIQLQSGENKEITSYTSGNFFGEMSIFENAPRSAMAYAKTNVMLMVIDNVSIQRIMDDHAETAVILLHRMLKVSTNRLLNTNNFVADIVRWGDEARERAIRDKVTGIYNRRYYDEVIHEEFQAAQNSGKPLSIVMVDLDRFRKINDIHGHHAGDSVIKKAARIFQLALRETDILVRYGGDEFAFLMPTTDLEEAFEITERVRQIIAGSEILFDQNKPSLRISVSIGIAGYPQNSTNLKELCRMADQALYRAKEKGRNKVICFENEILRSEESN